MALSIPRSLGLKLEDETVVACDSETLIQSCELGVHQRYSASYRSASECICMALTPWSDG